MLVAPTLRAQDFGGITLTYEKINVDQLKKNIEKSDAEIANPKKNTKAATWIKRGDLLVNVDGAPVNGLFVGIDEPTLKTTFGEVPVETVNIGSVPYSVYTYEHFKGYVKDGKLAFYIPSTVIVENALPQAYDAYAKAYDIDNKASKVGTGMKNINSRAAEKGGAYFGLQDYKAGADNFRLAYKASIHPSLGQPDTLSIYNAGFLGTLAGDYENALHDIEIAIALGYESNGDSYYYKFFCLYQLGRMQEATDVLEAAIIKYPNSDTIITALLDVYSTNPDKDPSGLVPLVLNVIKQNPNNPDLYVGLARVYDKLGQLNDAIEAARSAVAIDANSFLGNYYIGYYIAKQGDEKDKELHDMAITSREQYLRAQAEVTKIYAEAIPSLEKAYEINPSEIATIELLKNLTFRLRDTEGMSTKYEKYNALYKETHAE